MGLGTLARGPAPSPLAAEAELLIACARARVDPAMRSSLRSILAGPIDWPRLLELAGRHGMVPLLSLELESRPGCPLPAAALETLRARTSRNTAQQLLLVSELREILGLLERQGLRAVSFKGPALAAALHGNVALRESRAIALLVRREDAGHVREMLIARGYDAVATGPSVSRSAPIDDDGPLELVRERDGVRVELHWAMMHRTFRFPIEAMCWERLGRASLLGRSVPSLAPEDLLLVLCAHGAERCWERLIWVSDVAALLARHPRLDWNEVWRKAERLRCVRTLRLGLFLAGEWLGAGLPEEAARRVRVDRSIAALAARAVSAMMTVGEAPRMEWKRAFHARARDPIADRLSYRLGRVNPLRADAPTSLLRVPLGALWLLLDPARRAVPR